MKTRLFTRIPGIAVAGLLPLMVVGGLGLGAAAQAEAGPTLEGTWLNDVKIVTCPPAPHAVIATFQSMTTYMHGGLLMEGGGPATPPPAVSRSAGAQTLHRLAGVLAGYSPGVPAEEPAQPGSETH